jgi:transcriptional regulator with XRE-family HTH domain
MAISGNQLNAARAFAGLDQNELAKIAGVGVNTIRNMESADDSAIRAQTESLDAIEAALKDLGVEIANGDRPGVHLSSASYSSVWLSLDDNPNVFVIVPRDVVAHHLRLDTLSREALFNIARFNLRIFGKIANERRERRSHSPPDKKGQVRIVIGQDDLKDKTLLSPPALLE